MVSILLAANADVDRMDQVNTYTERLAGLKFDELGKLMLTLKNLQKASMLIKLHFQNLILLLCQ